MMDGTRKEGAYLECEQCGKRSLIPWNAVRVPGYMANTYGEFDCPECGAQYGIYTPDPIPSMNGKHERKETLLKCSVCGNWYPTSFPKCYHCGIDSDPATVAAMKMPNRDKCEKEDKRHERAMQKL